jgi:hypothetical protein
MGSVDFRLLGCDIWAYQLFCDVIYGHDNEFDRFSKFGSGPLYIHELIGPMRQRIEFRRLRSRAAIDGDRVQR